MLKTSPLEDENEVNEIIKFERLMYNGMYAQIRNGHENMILFADLTAIRIPRNKVLCDLATS